MPDDPSCRFCGADHATRFPQGGFAVCDSCAAGVREIINAHTGHGTEDAFGFEPIDYDYEPDDGELLYLACEQQFYEVDIRPEQTPALYLQPIPKRSPALPISDIDQMIGKAIANDDFYRVSLKHNNHQKGELWWQSALALAPTPSEHPQTETRDETEESETPERTADTEPATDGGATTSVDDAVPSTNELSDPEDKTEELDL